MGSFWRLEDDPSSVVLHKLQLPDGVGWSTVEHSVTVQYSTHAIRVREILLASVNSVKNVRRVTVDTCGRRFVPVFKHNEIPEMWRDKEWRIFVALACVDC